MTTGNSTRVQLRYRRLTLGAARSGRRRIVFLLHTHTHTRWHRCPNNRLLRVTHGINNQNFLADDPVKRKQRTWVLNAVRDILISTPLT